jgi:ribosomal protein S18 acetylase RimI-like enzyme
MSGTLIEYTEYYPVSAQHIGESAVSILFGITPGQMGHRMNKYGLVQTELQDKLPGCGEECRVRRAVSDDIGQLCALLMELAELEPDFGADYHRLRKGLELLMKTQGAAVFVAEAGKEVCGMCIVQSLMSTAEGGMVGLVEDVVVKKGKRRSGIGSGLMEAAINWSKAHGLTRLQLLADRENRSAVKFYKGVGWDQTRLICLRKKPL